MPATEVNNLYCDRCREKTEHRRNGHNTFRAGKRVQTWQCKECGKNQYAPMENTES